MAEGFVLLTELFILQGLDHSIFETLILFYESVDLASLWNIYFFFTRNVCCWCETLWEVRRL